MASNHPSHANPNPNPKSQHSSRRNKLINQSDDNTLVKQIRESHNSETHHVNVVPVLAVAEDILRRVAPSIDDFVHGKHEAVEALEEKPSVDGSFDDMLEGLSQIIHKISCEMFCKCSGSDLHSSTLAIFKLLSNYPWEAKVVLALAGFSVTYGEFGLVAQLCTTSPLAKAVAHLKQISDIVENSHALKPQLNAINELIKAIMAVTKCIVEFNELPTQYLSQDSAQLSVVKAHIPATAYWTVRSLVACAWHVLSLTDIRYEHMSSSTTEIWELSSLAHKLVTIHDLLAGELEGCRKHIVESIYEEEYRNLIRLIEMPHHMDNIKVLKSLISVREEQPLLFGTQKTRVSIETLRRKHVLLVISDLDVPHDEILVLYNMYDMRSKPVEAHYNNSNSTNHPRDTPSYEMVWLPVVDRAGVWGSEQEHKFAALLELMPWHAVHRPATVEPPVVKYVREKWHFDKKMLIVVLDPMGNVTSTNAMNMMWIWGNSAFPFSHEREEALWNAESWTLRLVIDGIDPGILQWIAQGRYICLYGGDDMEWIREFTRRAKMVAQALGIQIELIYAGKSNVPKERLNRIITEITNEKLSHCWPELASLWFFWSRIESMRCSKARLGKNIENDVVLKEVMVMLSYDGGDQGWASLWHGASEMARANGQLALLTLREFEQWQAEAARDGLVPAFENELAKRHSPQHCTRLILPGIGEDIPPKVVCTECGREMEKFFMFRCCTD